MTDTTPHIKELQLKIWLSKTPAERLKQFIGDNEVLLAFFEKAKESNQLINKTNLKSLSKDAPTINEKR
jgi:hypothetical protein